MTIQDQLGYLWNKSDANLCNSEQTMIYYYALIVVTLLASLAPNC